MLIKNLLSVSLMLIAGLLSINAHANVKYPASDFQPKIIFQSKAVQLIANPPKPQPAETPPIAQLLLIILLGYGGFYMYKTKFENRLVIKKIRPTKKRVLNTTIADPETARTQTQVKRINKDYKGYRSSRTPR